MYAVKKKLFLCSIMLAVCGGSAHAAVEDKIIEKITKFDAGAQYGVKPYIALQAFLKKQFVDPQRILAHIALEAEKAFNDRKDEICVAYWPDFIPYAIVRCITQLLQHGLDYDVFTSWDTVAEAIAKYNDLGADVLTADEVKDYYYIRHASQPEYNSYKQTSKERVKEKFIQNNAILSEKKETLKKLRVFANANKDGYMAYILNKKTVASLCANK